MRHVFDGPSRTCQNHLGPFLVPIDSETRLYHVGHMWKGQPPESTVHRSKPPRRTCQAIGPAMQSPIFMMKILMSDLVLRVVWPKGYLVPKSE